MTIRETRHGPLVGHLLADGEQAEALSVAWTGALPGDGIASLLGVARAESAEELLEALADHHEPVVAVAYADRKGAIGMQMAGWIPQRVLPGGLVPVPGQASVFDWRDPIPYQELPARRIGASDARRGTRWVVAADQPLGDGPDVGGIDWLWRTGDRERQFESLLRGLARAGPVELRAAANAHGDMVHAVAPGLVPALVELAGEREEQSPGMREVLDILEGWDGEMRPGSRGAAAYHVLLDNLVSELFTAPVGPALLARYLALPKVQPSAIAERILETAAGDSHSMGWSERARVEAAVRASLRRTGVSLAYRLGPNRARWDWGHLHQLAFRSFTGPGGGGRFSPELGPVSVSAVSSALGLADYDPAAPFAARTVPAYRLVIDLATADRMLSALAPGQSEHPGHPHFDDGLALWLRGGSSLVVSSRFLVEEESAGELRLEPVL